MPTPLPASRLNRSSVAHAPHPPPRLEHSLQLPEARPRLVVPPPTPPPTTSPQPDPVPLPPEVTAKPELPRLPLRKLETQTHVGEFASASSVAATVKLPRAEVQTGGFGSPNGLPGETEGGIHEIVAHTGSFDPAIGSGSGNGTGGQRGVRGVVASAGVGNTRLFAPHKKSNSSRRAAMVSLLTPPPPFKSFLSWRTRLVRGSRTIKLAMLVILAAAALYGPTWQADPAPQTGSLSPTPPGGSSSQTPPTSSGSTSGSPITQMQAPSSPRPGESELTHVVDAMIVRENHMLQHLRNFAPRVEIYMQHVRSDPELGAVPVNDEYFFGRLKLQPNGTLTAQSLLPQSSSRAHAIKEVAAHLAPSRTIQYYQAGAFYYGIVMDTTRFDREHYYFEFVRREFLGEVRCLVFDVKPNLAKHRRDLGLFRGRVWAEDQNYTIVRFNGTFGPAPRGSVYFHFDSWRENIIPGFWFPVYAYSEEPTLQFRAQVRLWGYGLETPTHQSEMTRVLVEAPILEQDLNQPSAVPSAVSSTRAWQQQAEDNVLERLQKGGFLAPPGDVDKVLETVVNNLVVTNHLDALPPIHCRVLLTSPLESLAVGNTIILSRGLIDVLPDEPSLAAMLAHELAHIVLQQTTNMNDTEWAFEDRLMVSDEKLLSYLNFRSSQQDEEAADAKALQLLKNSPYKDQLGNAGLFLRAMADMAPNAPQLFGTHLGTRLVVKGNVRRTAELMTSAPALQKNRVDQIAALPLGGRVKVNSWSDAVQLINTKPVALLSAREKMPFAVAPLFPYLILLPSEQASR